MSRMRRMLFVWAIVASGSGLAYAEEWQVVGARYQALGGAGVAIAFEADAADWNPGTLALASRTEEVSLRGGVALAAEGDFLDHAGRIVDFVDQTRIDSSIRKLRDGGSLNEGELRNALVLFVDQAPKLQPD